MSNKVQLQTNNAALDGYISRINTAKEVAASLPEIESGREPVIEPLSVDQNGVYEPPIGVDGYSPVSVAVTPIVDELLITPTEQPQFHWATDNNLDGWDVVHVNPIPGEYIVTNDATALASEILNGKTAYVKGEKVTGTIPTKTSSDLTASGATVTVPSGYYASQATKSITSGSAKTPATTITKNPTISVNSSGLITASVSGTQSVTPTVSAGYVSSGTAGTITVSGSTTQQLTTQGAKTITPSTSAQTAVASGVYTTGAVTVAAVPTQTKSATPTSSAQTISPDSGKFLSSVTVNAIPSTYVQPTSTKDATTYTPSTSNQTIAAGTYCSGAQTIQGDSNLVAENIKKNVSIFGVNGSYEGSGGGSGGGDVGGLTQYTKTYATPGSKAQLTIINPLGGLAKKISIKCADDANPWVTSGLIQKYTMDAIVGLGSMRLTNASTGNVTTYATRQVSSITSNSQFLIEDGRIVARSYNQTTAMWDTTCEYEVEIWQ